MYQTGDRRRHIADHPLPEIPLEETEGIYEEIDELNMIDNVGNLRDGDISVADTNGSYVQPDNNGYLTPFQPDDEYTSTDNSNDNKSESLASSLDYHSFSIDPLSTSSSSDVQERRSSYLNPYQPLVHSADIHEYSSTNIINESSSSGSETLWRGSGYLNPYQPMVPDLIYMIMNLSRVFRRLIFSDVRCATKEIVPDFPHPCQDQKSEIDTQEYKSGNDISSETVSEGDIACFEHSNVFQSKRSATRDTQSKSTKGEKPGGRTGRAVTDRRRTASLDPRSNYELLLQQLLYTLLELGITAAAGTRLALQ
ncbi:unnamed protein product [Mytilus coruscus]|uniref:Uncharacterized protein n=1 Tax=Mytilus coruscus TaxID=42192 RepID=A0A6J8DRS2_MYTCO|nr:unnamed protein product [Mytilus coruscus]